MKNPKVPVSKQDQKDHGQQHQQHQQQKTRQSHAPKASGRVSSAILEHERPEMRMTD